MLSKILSYRNILVLGAFAFLTGALLMWWSLAHTDLYLSEHYGMLMFRTGGWTLVTLGAVFVLMGWELYWRFDDDSSFVLPFFFAFLIAFLGLPELHDSSPGYGFQLGEIGTAIGLSLAGILFIVLACLCYDPRKLTLAQ